MAGEELEQGQTTMSEPFTEENLRRCTGIPEEQDLEATTSVDIQVDASENSLRTLGQKLPNLSELHLNGSRIPSLRALGTTFQNLTILWVARCGLEDLEGLGGLPKLQELYASFNHVSELAPLVACDSLVTVDLEGNKVDDIEEVSFAGVCPSLSAIVLQGNPIASRPEYRREVLQEMPQVRMLDDGPVKLEDKVQPKKVEAAESYPDDEICALMDAMRTHQSPSTTQSLANENEEVIADRTLSEERVAQDAFSRGAPSSIDHVARAKQGKRSGEAPARNNKGRSRKPPRKAPQHLAIGQVAQASIADTAAKEGEQEEQGPARNGSELGLQEPVRGNIAKELRRKRQSFSSQSESRPNRAAAVLESGKRASTE